jgi:hypothetical protein
MIDEQVQTLLDRDGIRECITRLARAEDRRDAGLLRAVCWPDFTCDHGISAGTLDDYQSWVVPGSAAIPVTQHALGQSLIDVHGDAAVVETHVTAYHRMVGDGGANDVVIGGRYLDRMQKRDGEWRIAHRTMVYDWYRELGASFDWSQGLMGAPLPERYLGRATGDLSGAFLRDMAFGR